MSAQSLAFFLRRRMSLQGLSNSEVAAKAGISRQTWYSLLNADIKEAKLSTLIQIAVVLKIHPMEMLGVYFGENDVWKFGSEV